MNNMQLAHVPIAATGMLVRRPVAQVFEAIVNPEITTKFWFSKGSGRLEFGKSIAWEWESHDVSNEVMTTIVEPNKRVVIEWPGYTSCGCRNPDGPETPTSSSARSPIPRRASRCC